MQIATFLAILGFFYVLGVLTGLAITYFIAVMMSKQHEDARRFAGEFKSMIAPAGHRRGSIHLPTSEVEQERQRIISENREKGLDTPISQLRDHEQES